jgi:hypothetical protein
MLASSDSESSYSTCRDPCRGNRTAVRVFEYSTCCTVLPCFGQHCIIGSGTADSVLVSRRSHKTKLLLTSPRSRPYTEFWASIGHTRSTLLVRGTSVRSQIHNLYGILSTLFLLPAHVPSTRTAVQPYVYSARSIITAAAAATAAAAGGAAAVSSERGGIVQAGRCTGRA